MPKPDKIHFKLIITIVGRGKCGNVLDASKEAGAEGGTIIKGRGSGVHEKAKLFSITIEPEKDIVLTLIPEDRAEAVMDSIIKSANLNQPGNGIAFMIDIEKVAGINHLIE